MSKENKEILFAKTLEQVRNTAKEQGSCISKEQVEAAFGPLALDKEQMEMVYAYLHQSKIGIGEPVDPDEYLAQEEKEIGGREGRKEGRRKGGRKAGREREGGKEEGREGGKKGGTEKRK